MKIGNFVFECYPNKYAPLPSVMGWTAFSLVLLLVAIPLHCTEGLIELLLHTTSSSPNTLVLPYLPYFPNTAVAFPTRTLTSFSQLPLCDM